MEVEVPEVREIRAGIKLKINNFINNNDDDPFGYLALIKFTFDHHITISSSVDDYINGNRPLKRKIFAYFHIVIGWVVILRFAILAIINKPWIWSLLGDPYYILGGDNLIQITLNCATLMGVIGQHIILYYEKKMDLSFVIFLKEVMDNTTEYRLQHRYYLRFCKISKFLVRWPLLLVYKAGVSILMTLYLILTIKAYLDPDMDFSIIAMILPCLLNYFCFTHYAAFLLVSFIWMTASILYFKYEFKQIKVKIQECVKSRNSRHLIDAIHEHNYCTRHIYNLNKVFSKGLFLNYFFSTPGMDIILHLAIYKSINVYMRIIYVLIFSQLVLLLYIYSYITSSLSSAAHDCTSDLYAFIVRNRSNRRNKFKISAFVEKLCGPTIGIYCYDFFAFTTFEFYQYIAFVSSTYFLLNGLIFDT